MGRASLPHWMWPVIGVVFSTASLSCDQESQPDAIAKGVQFTVEGDLIYAQDAGAVRISGIGSARPTVTEVQLPAGVLMSPPRARACDHLAVFSRKGVLRVLDSRGAGKPAVLRALSGVRDLAIMGDGARVLTVSVLRDSEGNVPLGEVQLWDLAKGGVIRSVARLCSKPRIAALEGSERAALILTSGEQIEEVDVATGQVDRTFFQSDAEGGIVPSSSVAISDDGAMVAAGGYGAITVWARKTGEVVWQYREKYVFGRNEPFDWQLVYLNGQSGLVCVTRTSVRLFGYADGKILATDESSSIPSSSCRAIVSLSADGRHLAVWGVPGPRVYRTAALRLGNVEVLNDLPLK